MENLTSKNYQEVMKNPIVFVDFWASWCGPCRAMAPIYEKVAEKYEGRAKFLKCNVDEEHQLALKQGIVSIPCIIAYKNGIAVDKNVGLVSEDMFSSFVDKQF